MAKIKLVEMRCDITAQSQKEVTPPEGFTAKALDDTRADDLYPCYLAAFKAGDSKLFAEQSEAARHEFYQTLAFEQARNEPGSSMVLKGDQIVGFTIVVPDGERNQHISCMCVHPQFQHQGLGAFMLRHAKVQAGAQGQESMTLWTEIELGAFELYRKHGFKITEGKEL